MPGASSSTTPRRFARRERRTDGRAPGGLGQEGAAGDLRGPAQPRRPRLRRLQGEDLPAPRAAAHAGAPARHARRPTSSACGRTRRRSRLAVPRPADRRHQLLPRRGGLRGARGARHPAAVRGQGAGRHGAGLGARLRDRRGGLFDRHPAARAHGRDCGRRRRCRSSPPTSTRRRSQVARAGRYPAALLDGVAAGAPASASSTATAARYERREARCGTCASSPRTASSATRPSRGSTWSPAATC